MSIKASHFVGHLTVCLKAYRNEQQRNQTKFYITGPFYGESTGNRWIPHTKGQQCISVHVMLSSCISDA